MNKSAKDYTENILHSMQVNFANGCNVYYGKKGALRLAREYGYGLNDFSKKEAIDEMKNSYSKLFVKLYVFGPFTKTLNNEEIDAKEWCNEIKGQLKLEEIK